MGFMHRTYRTEAIVIETTNFGEANRFVYLLTEELGLIGAAAQGVRQLQSRMRLHTDCFMLGRFSLVRGRNMWRLTNALTTLSMGAILAERDLLPVAARITALVRRLVHGEESNPRLYITVRDALDALVSACSTLQAHAIERIAVARVLHILGYLATDRVNMALVNSLQYDTRTLVWADREARSLTVSINQSLRESQL
jgi:DNA repair protein RecO